MKKGNCLSEDNISTFSVNKVVNMQLGQYLISIKLQLPRTEKYKLYSA